MTRLQASWYGLMVAEADRSAKTCSHILWPSNFAVAAAGLLVLRTVLARPVPGVIPERTLVSGCLLGAATFLAGNFINTSVIAGTPR